MKDTDRRTREQRRAAATIKALCVGLLLLGLGLAVLLTHAKAAPEPPVCDDGSLPGDDIPASGYASLERYEEDHPEAAENENIEAAILSGAVKLENVTVTHYCICQKCCGKRPDHPAYGITASGVRATPDVTAAVDPSVIPLGADVLVDYGDGELHYCRADDTGSGVGGNHIDLCVSTHQEALSRGVKTATVYWRMPT